MPVPIRKLNSKIEQLNSPKTPSKTQTNIEEPGRAKSATTVVSDGLLLQTALSFTLGRAATKSRHGALGGRKRGVIRIVSDGPWRHGSFPCLSFLPPVQLIRRGTELRGLARR
jgi:hypothetical protein